MKDSYDQAGYAQRKAFRGYVYNFGTLQQCRDSWSKINGKVIWEEYNQMEIHDGDPF